MRLTGRAERGEVGAGYAELADGTPAVLTVAAASVAELRSTGQVLTRIAAAGIPAPNYLAVVDLGDRRAIVQQRLPGRAPERIDGPLIEQLLALVDRFAGLGGVRGSGAGRESGEDRGSGEGSEPGGGAAAVNLYLTSSGPGFCVHDTLARYDTRSRRLLDRIHEVGAAAPPREVGADLVHLDLHPGNLLVDDGVISGLVDWDGIGRGDRRFCLVTLSFDLSFGLRFRDTYRHLPQAALMPLLCRLADASQDRVRAWWASMSLRQVDWTIRHAHPTATIDFYLALAERGLDDLERGPLSVASIVADV